MIVFKALAWGAGIALYLRFGLEPTAWVFYEASHFFSLDWIYWGYSGFRVGSLVFDLWTYQNLACISTGLLIALLVYWRSTKKLHRQDT